MVLSGELEVGSWKISAKKLGNAENKETSGPIQKFLVYIFNRKRITEN
jgi:hypothetical protein